MPSSVLTKRRPPRSTLFPSTTLFRSSRTRAAPPPPRLPAGRRGNESSKAKSARDRKSTRLNSSHMSISDAVFCFNETATPEIYPLPLHDALPIFSHARCASSSAASSWPPRKRIVESEIRARSEEHTSELQSHEHLGCRLLF